MLKITRRCPECGMADPYFKRMTPDQFPCLGCGALLKADSFKSNVVGVIITIVLGVPSFEMSANGFPLWFMLLAVALPGGGIYLAVLPFITKLYLVAKGPCCLKCIYNLQGIDTERTSSCPECGEAISPAWLDKMRQGELIESESGLRGKTGNTAGE